MEFQFSFLAITFFFFFSFLWLAKNYKQKCQVNSSAHKLPPGRWKLPFIGNLHQLTAPRSLPHHALRQHSQKHGPLIHLQHGEISALVVSSSAIAQGIMKTHDLAFVQRPQLLCPKILAYDSTDIAFAPYGDYWRQMRKICTSELLSAKRVHSFSLLREDEVSKLIESIQLSSGSPINLSAKIFPLINNLVSRASLGDKSKYEDELLGLIKEGVEMTGGFDLADLFPSKKAIHFITGMEGKLQKMLKKLDRILESIIKEHQEKRMRDKEEKGEAEKENLLDVLLRVQQSGSLDIPITTDNIKAVIWEIFAAGTDTSATFLEWAMPELMRNPKVREKAQDELRQAFRGKKTIQETDLEQLNYLKFVIKETLRLHPPVPLLLPRECREPCKIDGYDIPIKIKVIVNAWALGRDPKYWYEAESFMPERFNGNAFDFKGTNFEYIPFGGRRICSGITFGLANVELPLARLLYHFDWKLPNGMKRQDLDMTECFGAAVGRKNNLYLIPIPYNHSLYDNPS